MYMLAGSYHRYASVVSPEPLTLQTQSPLHHPQVLKTYMKHFGFMLYLQKYIQKEVHLF